MSAPEASLLYGSGSIINSSDSSLNQMVAGQADAPVRMAAAAAADTPAPLGFWDSITDERVNEFYLLRGGPSIILAVVSVYLYFVLSLGPRLMATSAPFKLNKLLLIYNLCMALANLWLFVQGLHVSNYGLDTWGCGKFGGDIRKSPRRGIYLGYLFFLTKLIELLDTVFFVLRKKKEQVTFLHVFHHSIVPIFCWIGIKLAPGGPNGFFPLVNSFIHVIMYSYYALTTLGARVQPYLWWKKYLTSLQMCQFVLVMINAAKTFMSRDCKFPLLFSYLQALVASAFLVLFAMFYRDAYLKKQKRNKQLRLAAAAEAKLRHDHDHHKHQHQDNPNSTLAQAKATVAAVQRSVSKSVVAASNLSDSCEPVRRNANGTLKWRADTFQKKSSLIV